MGNYRPQTQSSALLNSFHYFMKIPKPETKDRWKPLKTLMESNRRPFPYPDSPTLEEMTKWKKVAFKFAQIAGFQKRDFQKDICEKGRDRRQYTWTKDDDSLWSRVQPGYWEYRNPPMKKRIHTDRRPARHSRIALPAREGDVLFETIAKSARYNVLKTIRDYFYHDPDAREINMKY